jgi:hypothetical protein
MVSFGQLHVASHDSLQTHVSEVASQIVPDGQVHFSLLAHDPILEQIPSLIGVVVEVEGGVVVEVEGGVVLGVEGGVVLGVEGGVVLGVAGVVSFFVAKYITSIRHNRATAPPIPAPIF